MSYLAKPNVPIPLSPRLNVYLPNGHGRDSYIYTNNGGLYKSGMRIVSSNDSHLGPNVSRMSYIR